MSARPGATVRSNVAAYPGGASVRPNVQARPAAPVRAPKRDRGRGDGHVRGRNRGDKAREGGAVVVIQGEIQKNSKGFAFLLHKPEDLFIPRELAEKLLTGDIAKVWFDPRRKAVVKLETVKRSIKSFIGTYEASMNKRVVVLADRTMREEVIIREEPRVPGLAQFDKVQVEITKYEPRLEGRIVRSFGATLAPKFDTLAVVVRSQWPQEFSPEAQADAVRLCAEVQADAAASGYKGRRDLRDRPFVTIDGKDSRDFDDAVLVEKTSSGFVLYVAIADVSAFVVPGTKLDEEAFGRSTSVYFPEWVIPMLPEALSNGACSLRPNEEKLTLCCEMHFDASGKKRSTKIYETVVKSARRCIYEDVQREHDEGLEFWKAPYELFEKIKISRNRRGALDLDLPEAKIVLDENSDTIDIKKTERLNSHRLIEEFMIVANESVTEIMEREGWPFVYRVHEPPKTDALERFERFAIALGLKPNLADGKDPKRFARFIETLKDNPFATTLYYLMLRSLKQARYDAVNLKHFGLASEAYTHFTSPIRRYPDLMVHRLLKRFIHRQNFNETQFEEFTDYLVDACDHCSKQERKAETLDRTVTKVKKARFMAKHLGEEFDACITNVNENGLYVELVPWFVDGLVPIAELESDYFDFIEAQLMLKGKRTGKKYKIGDTIRVSVLRTDVDNGFVDFTLSDAII
ncbi:MAG: ribonuclease R [Deltaproteobacteria bacterium]|nr:ribonuclease R [Deltaproteobacteria bacterium]